MKEKLQYPFYIMQCVWGSKPIKLAHGSVDVAFIKTRNIHDWIEWKLPSYIKDISYIEINAYHLQIQIILYNEIIIIVRQTKYTLYLLFIIGDIKRRKLTQGIGFQSEKCMDSINCCARSIIWWSCAATHIVLTRSLIYMHTWSSVLMINKMWV